jgi:hypothetical protein
MDNVEAIMATAISSHAARRQECAFYEIDPRTGATVEIFYANGLAAQSFGARGAGFYWRQRGSANVPSGPFLICLDAYRDALDRH